MKQKTQMNVSILLDTRNNWIEKYIKKSKIVNKYQIKIEYNLGKIIDQDIVFIIGYTKILDQDFLQKNILNIVCHESYLPQGKGFAPVQWQILEGKSEIPVVLIEANKIVDSGDILLRTSFQLTGEELYPEIRKKQAEATIKAIHQFLEKYPDINREKQIGIESFYQKRTQKDSELNIKKSIEEQFNLLRISNNKEWPAFFYIGKKKYIIKISKAKNEKTIFQTSKKLLD